MTLTELKNKYPGIVPATSEEISKWVDDVDNHTEVPPEITMYMDMQVQAVTAAVKQMRENYRIAYANKRAS